MFRITLPQYPCLSIHPEKSSCIVTTEKRNKFRAKKVVISISTPLYKMINFSPHCQKPRPHWLPQPHLDTMRKRLSSMASYGGEILASGPFISFNGAVSFSYDTSVEADG